MRTTAFDMPDSAAPLGSAMPSGGCRAGRGETVERPSQQARDVHLRDPDLLRDLGLREVLLEAQPQDRALSLGQGAERPAQHLADLHELVAVLVRGDRVAPAPVVVV